MPHTVPALISSNDSDWQSFKSGDEDYYLRVAGSAIRKYVGWHLWPSKTVTVTKIQTGSQGLVMLPSRHVTDVTEVLVENQTDPENPTVLDPGQYTWFEGGWIQRTGAALGGWGWGWPGAYYYGPDAPYYLPVYNFGLVDVTFTHGYDILPDDIKQVAFELATSTMTVQPGLGNIKEVQSPQYKTVFGQTPGLNLNPNQTSRLANYRLGRFA
jgi:hypothetical protein